MCQVPTVPLSWCGHSHAVLRLSKLSGIGLENLKNGINLTHCSCPQIKVWHSLFLASLKMKQECVH